MGEITTIGLDLAKHVFQVHGVDAAGQVVVRRQLRRGELLKFFAKQPPCLVGMEACGTSHHWAREIAALGHTVKMMPPAYVKPYVKRGKTDAADAEAICEAVTRPTMRFVPTKTMEQQSVLMLHKVRDLLIKQRTMLINALRSHLAEFGIVPAQGPAGVQAAIVSLHEMQDQWPEPARAALHGIVDQLRDLARQIEKAETRLQAWHREDEISRRLAQAPGTGPITASANRSDRAGCVHRSIGSTVRGMAGFDAEGAQQWWQGEARRHQQAGRQLPAAPACGRRGLGHTGGPQGNAQQTLGDQAA